MSQPLRVLILEDRPDDAELVVEHLKRAGLNAAFERADTEAGFAAKLHAGLDLILPDYNQSQFNAPLQPDILKARPLHIPSLVFSGPVAHDPPVQRTPGGAAHSG